MWCGLELECHVTAPGLPTTSSYATMVTSTLTRLKLLYGRHAVLQDVLSQLGPLLRQGLGSVRGNVLTNQKQALVSRDQSQPIGEQHSAYLTGAPADTRPTMMLVEVELDWTSTVTRTPIIRPTMGF